MKRVGAWWRSLPVKVRSALYRALRTFLQAFLGTYATLPQLDVHVAALKLAAAAGVAAVVALVMRWLDDTGVPTIPPG